MQYEKYLKNVKKIIKKMPLIQKIAAGIFLIAIFSLVIYLVNPQKKLLERRNSQRRSDVVNILNAVYQYGTDHGEQLSALIPSVPTAICKSQAQSCEGLVDISQIIAAEKKLLSAVPEDPKSTGQNDSGYQISRLANGRISVSAPLAENGAVISLSK